MPCLLKDIRIGSEIQIQYAIDKGHVKREQKQNWLGKKHDAWSSNISPEHRGQFLMWFLNAMFPSFCL